MDRPIKPGEFVVRRIRWNFDASLMGIVIGHDDEPDERYQAWLVMWTVAEHRAKFTWHLANSLLVVDPDNVSELKTRGRLRS